MGLDSLLTSLKAEVSEVSQVQAPDTKAFGRYPIETGEVSGVSKAADAAMPDTSDTPCKTMGYQREPLRHKGCTPDTSDTPKNINVPSEAAKVGASDPAIQSRAWTLHFAGKDPATLIESKPAPDPFPDDRRTCRQCLNLSGRGCVIAAPGGLVSARRGYEPMPDLPRRCEGYSPIAEDPDQRPVGERWPGL